jgi:type VI secretion system secreted protein Hcp
MAFDTFLKIDGLTDPETNGLEVLSFSWGASEQTSQGSNHATGKVTLSDLSIMKKVDPASPKLFQACVTGQHFQKVQLLALRNDDSGRRQPFYKLTLGDVVVGSIQHAGSAGGDDTPTESVSLNFAKVEIVYNG